MTGDNTIPPREGEAFTQTLKRRKARETSKVARFAAQAEKDRTRRELEALSKVRHLMRAWHDDLVTPDELAVALWMVTR